jgi:hypothetical protein
MTPASTVPAEIGLVGDFIGRLRFLTGDDLVEIARASEDGRETVAGEIEWWRATVSVSRDLRRLRCSRRAAMASLRASEAVLASPGAAEVSRDHLVHAARVAEEVARALVAGSASVIHAGVVPGWGAVVRATLASSTRPSAA